MTSSKTSTRPSKQPVVNSAKQPTNEPAILEEAPVEVTAGARTERHSGRRSGAAANARTLVHETWGDHAALLARSDYGSGASVGEVTPRLLDVATPEDPLKLQLGGELKRVAVAFEEYGKR